MERNQKVAAQAFKKTKRKLQRIKELGITPDMTEEQIDKIVVDLATAKALDNEGSTVEDHLDGQQWYVESLVKASGMTSQEVFEAEYDDSFADVASDDEMFSLLDQVRSA